MSGPRFNPLTDGFLVDCWRSCLTPTQAQVVRLLIRFRDNETGACFPSADRLAVESGRHDSGVRDTLDQLRKLRAVSWIEERTPKGHPRRYFSIHWDAILTVTEDAARRRARPDRRDGVRLTELDGWISEAGAGNQAPGPKPGAGNQAQPGAGNQAQPGAGNQALIDCNESTDPSSTETPPKPPQGGVSVSEDSNRIPHEELPPEWPTVADLTRWGRLPIWSLYTSEVWPLRPVNGNAPIMPPSFELWHGERFPGEPLPPTVDELDARGEWRDATPAPTN